MTRRRKQKQRIRARMARSGESYTTARAGLLRRATTTIAGRPVFMIPVHEMPRAIAFYRDALGFSLLGRNADDSWAELGTDTTTLALHAGAPAGVDTGLGLLVPDLAAACHDVAAFGGRLADGTSPSDPVVVVQDPDGNVLRLMHGRTA